MTEPKTEEASATGGTRADGKERERFVARDAPRLR